MTNVIYSCENSGSNSKESQSSQKPSQIIGGNSGQGSSSFVFNSDDISYALGSKNLGNTCFVNATHKLIWALLGEKFQVSNSPKDNPVQIHFYEYMENLNKRLNILVNSPEKLAQSTQEDPLHATILDKLFNSITVELSKNGGNGTLNGSAKLKQNQYDAGLYIFKLFDLININLISSFSFKILSQETYAGKTYPLKYQEYQNSFFHEAFYLSATEFIGSLNFQEVLKNNLHTVNYTNQEKTEVMIMDYYLSQANLAKAPKNIIFNYLNPNNMKGKNQIKKIIFPEAINLAFYNFDLSESVNKKYNIKGVVIYRGNGVAGHNYSYIKTYGTWYKHNDSHVSPIILPENLKTMIDDIEANTLIYLFELAD